MRRISLPAAFKRSAETLAQAAAAHGLEANGRFDPSGSGRYVVSLTSALPRKTPWLGRGGPAVFLNDGSGRMFTPVDFGDGKGLTPRHHGSQVTALTYCFSNTATLFTF